MRRLLLPVLLATLCLATGCGRGDESTPVACLEGAGAYRRALAAAPGEVLLGEETPISNCLTENQEAGQLSQVGEAMIETATKLNAAARAEPDGKAALQLGYLLGAASRGADETEGIHSDLIRRLTVAARYSPGKQPLPPALLAAYREGFDAGRSGG